jgi:integrase
VRGISPWPLKGRICNGFGVSLRSTVDSTLGRSAPRPSRLFSPTLRSVERFRRRRKIRRCRRFCFCIAQVLGLELPWLHNVTRALRPERLPVVLTHAQVHSLLSHLDGTPWLIASLLYGSGLRLSEALGLRVKDVVLEKGAIVVRDAKGAKDRITVLPVTAVNPLRIHLEKLRVRFDQQRQRGEPGVSLPNALARKYPRASADWSWQYVFPAASVCRDISSGQPVRHHFVNERRRPGTNCAATSACG